MNPPPPRDAAVVTPVFTAVRGRARLRVAGLRGRPLLAARLEDHVNGRHAVRHARANPVTGTILILFDTRRIDVPRLMGEVALDVERARRSSPTPGTADGRRHRAWHTVTDAAALARLGTSMTGLTTETATERLSTLGGNRMPAPRAKSPLAIVRGHLLSAPVIVLVGAAFLSLVSGALVEAGVIVVVVVVNTAVGYVTEQRVERILHSLQQGGAPDAIVRREGRDVVVPASALVPGDLIVVRAGADVPADARLLEADRLVIDESALTGESLPVTKSAHVLRRVAAPLADRVNMLFAGTVVAEGSGLAVVTATGRDTEFGRVRTLVAHTRPTPTPLEQQLERAGRRLVAVSLGFCAATLALGLLRGLPALATTRMVISLGVAAVPEGLPAVATTTLALGMQRMMRRRTLVRRLAAVESLGATTVICADKTGTLTENRMTVAAWYLGRREFRPHGDKPGAALTRAMTLSVLCNEAKLHGDEVSGSATEGALLTAALDAGIDYRDVRARHHLLALRPRAEGENWMAAVHGDGTRRRLLTVKGAPEEVLARASTWLDDDVERPLTPQARAAVLRANARLARSGMRVLGLACKELEPDTDKRYEDLVWIGLVAFTDPVRMGVREALAACRTAGVRTIILTGDQAYTAAAVCRELQLVPNGRLRVMEAARLATLDGDALRAVVRDIDVFARVSPVHKYQIVRALQASGEVVAMTGDGINDAAALKAADIGVAMGARGTDVARDVADVVLADDDFGSLVRAIEQGRSIHRNIGRTLRFLLATNFSEILLTLGALALGVPSPMSAIQFLWINLLSDLLPALALALEAPEPDLMRRPPRDPAAPLLDRAALTTIAADAGVLAAASLAVHGIARARYGAGPHATTLAFSTLTTAQLLHALTSRHSTAGGSPLLLGVVAGSVGLQLLAVAAPPLRRLLGTTALSGTDWALVAAGVGAPLLARRALAGARPSLTL